MKHKLLGMFLAFGVFAANAADFYVDANSTVETPDGSQASPYKTIVEAVNAANANLAGPNTIYIHGGNDRVYLFSTADDLITIKAANTTLCAWPDTGKPLLELASDLYAKVGKGLSVMTMDATEKPKDVVLKNLRFKFYSKSLVFPQKSLNSSKLIFIIIWVFCLNSTHIQQCSTTLQLSIASFICCVFFHFCNVFIHRTLFCIFPEYI